MIFEKRFQTRKSAKSASILISIESANRCVPDRTKDKLSLMTVSLVNANESQFNDPNTTLIFTFSCPILNTTTYLVTTDSTTIMNSTNTTSNVTVFDKIPGEKTMLNFIALDTYDLPIVASFDLYFGSISMPVHIRFPNGSAAANVFVRASLTESSDVGQSGYTNEAGTIVFTNVPLRTVSIFARTTNNQIAVTGIAPSWQGVSLTLIPFGNSSSSKTVVINELSFRKEFIRHRTRRDVNLPGFVINTSGQTLQMASRVFTTENNSASVYVRYKFVTTEVPGGYFGSIFNDYFVVTIRSEKGLYETLSQSMNGLGLGAFNYSTGETNWYTLKLQVTPEPQLIQVDVGVANVADGALQSWIIVDKIGTETCEKCDDCEQCPSDPMCRDTCLNPPLQSCLFYTDCMEAKIRCGASGYALDYGAKYCKKYQNRLASFTSQGQQWIHKTMNCLQKALVAPLQNCDNTCANLRQIAFNSHPSCYISSGVCDLPADDWYYIFTTVAKDLFTIDGFYQALQTAPNCIPSIIDRLDNELTNAIGVVKIKLFILRQWFQSL